jgi:hypothetical protein
VELAGAQSLGNSPDARRALGLQLLTARDLATDPLPDAEWVTIGFRMPRGREEEIRFKWLVTERPPSPSASPERAEIFKFLFAPETLKKPPSRLKGLASKMPGYFRAKAVRTPYGRFGYIRIFSFDVAKAEDLVCEFLRLIQLKRFPKNGLIIDVRDNGGGRTEAAEMLLQFICPVNPIVPQGVYFRNSPQTLELCQLQRTNQKEGPRGLAPWIESIQRSLETSAMFSANFHRNDQGKCNLAKPHQKYPGKVIVITNALCYSATEFFAAGFQDHGGKILGVDTVTGGGGATVRTHDELRNYFAQSSESPFQALPHKIGFRVAYRRSQRVRAQAGNDVEDFGVRPNYFYRMSRDDALDGNFDLICCAASYLAGDD